MSFAGRASGKVILLGEHAVVYGAPALVAGIERGARAEAELLPEGEPSRLVVRSTGSPDVVIDANDDRAKAFAALLACAPCLPATRVIGEGDLPPAAGLGSSAALGVAIARAAIAAAGREVFEAETIARATAWERVFHGNPSGIDTAAAAIGGCFRFTRATREGEPNGVRPVVPLRDLVLCVGLSGVSASTRDMVEGVARLRARKPEVVDRAVEGVTSLVDNATLAIEAGDLAALGKLMDLNQMILAGLMLSTETLEALCASARRAGALGAKLTGKGGGGAVLALAADDARAADVLAAWRAAGYEGFVTRVAASTMGPQAAPNPRGQRPR